MSAEDTGRRNLEARLRGLLGGMDASAGFEARVMQRVSMLAVAPREDLRVQFERRRELRRRRLRREVWMNGMTTLGLGACAAALLWRFAPEIQRLAANSASLIDPGLLAVGTLAALGAGVWLLISRARG
ncbi:MAG TPA: hypothetical protein VI339_03155 [Steroidobacteraceae bacterium]|nr:hypothetical protein [Steroidobacteraceae bacterium]